MARSVKGTNQAEVIMIPTDAIVGMCSSRKSVVPRRNSTPSSIRRGSLQEVADDWISRLANLPIQAPAEDMYVGRGFRLSQEAAKLTSARLYILSAGLGIVRNCRAIPAYGMTVSLGHSESISERVKNDFDPSIWFERLCLGPFSDKWSDVSGRGAGRILVALSRPYAEMVGTSLAKVPMKMRSRLRLFGASLHQFLPEALHPSIAPYDERLNALLPGTRSDFAQRAMLHFARSIANLPSKGRDDDFARVAVALKSLDAPAHVRRPRLTDEELLAIIEKRMRSQSGAVKMLTALRHEDGVACERSRFGRLYRIASERRIS